MKINSNKGFSLVEALVVTGILLLTFVTGLSIYNTIDKGQVRNEASLNFTLVRNHIVSLILDDTSWLKTIGVPGNAGNPNFSCLLNQNSLTPADRNCFNKNDRFVSYDIAGNLHVMNGITAFDFSSATQGFTNKGLACDTFDGSVGGGNPQCPFQMVVTWKSLCTASPCVNPAILFEGRAQLNSGPSQAPLNTDNLAFQIIKSNLYCPGITLPTNHLASDGTVNVAIDKVKSNLVTDTPNAAIGTSDQVLAPCRKTIVTFSEDMNPAFTPNANNNSSVFLQDETTGLPVFEFRRIASGVSYDYQLLYNGVSVFNAKPSWVSLTKDSIFKLEVTNGLVRFCQNDRCPFYFPQKLDFPFRVGFRPASGLFTPEGINLITYTSFDL